MNIEQARQLYLFLQGHQIAPINCRNIPRLSARAAFSVIYVLQEKFHIIPDTFEKCTRCHELFDTYYGGEYVEKTGRHYCENCAE